MESRIIAVTAISGLTTNAVVHMGNDAILDVEVEGRRANR
jgi:hypothetical protein